MDDDTGRAPGNALELLPTCHLEDIVTQDGPDPSQGREIAAEYGGLTIKPLVSWTHSMGGHSEIGL